MARKLDTMKIQVFGGPAQVVSGPAQVISGPGWAWSMSPWNQESMSPDQFLGPWDPFGEILRPMEAEGRLFGAHMGHLGPWLLSSLGGLLVDELHQ